AAAPRLGILAPRQHPRHHDGAGVDLRDCGLYEAGMEGGVRWVEPDDAKPAEGRNGGRGASGGMSFPTSFGPAQSTL
ncbi:hypothetical protein GUG97_22545, partial [Xanthomonas citri pv. citri]|nr:hypothetical protein [Xanthomonas citri pv. citri]